MFSFSCPFRMDGETVPVCQKRSSGEQYYAWRLGVLDCG